MQRYRQETRERQGGGGPFDVEIREFGMTPRVESTIYRTEAPPEVAALLGAGDVVVRARRMFADDVPLQIASSYIPADIAEGTVLEQQNTGAGGLISRMAELGYTQVRMAEHITVRPPTTDEADFFTMSSDERVFVIRHVGYTAEGRAVEAALQTLPTHHWELDYEWDVEPGT
ncbi:GntR family transcriptional regulator [Actinomadura rayongensis]|nr:GntR family transcriptional regulator [Actinomadura rayongensis]